MKRNLKALGLALAATFAMSAVAASAAQATQANFKADSFPAVMTGHEEAGTENYFQITGTAGPKTECNEVTYEATAAEEGTTLTVTPHYTDCNADGNNATVALNGCHYVFEAGTKLSASESEGFVEIVCPGGGPITVTIAGICRVDIGPQTLEGITFTNKNGDVTVDVDITHEIHYVETDLSFFCPNSNNHTTEDGNFVSSVLVEGFEDKGTHESASTPGTNEYTEGNPVNIEVG